MNPNSNSTSHPAPKRLSLDLSPKRTDNATSNTLIPAADHNHRPKPAAALHSRIKPAHVIDLRQSVAPAPAPTPAIIQSAAHHTPAAPPKATAHERHVAQFSDRFNQAKQYDRSPHINKFAHQVEAAPAAQAAVATLSAPVAAHEPRPQPVVTAHTPAPNNPGDIIHPVPGQELPQLAATHHEAMTRLAHPTPTAEVVATKAKADWRPHLKLSPHTGRFAATATAIVIMGSYIWLQNYPKLALQSANNKAGVSASLPGYMPSSYNLVSTDVAPGLVSLSYGNPNADKLRIAQTRTTWDSGSLLENFVTKNTDDYATVQGQGLTIYLWGNNQAAWVNHGIWYSIEGATRLSREQILKIAYSL